MTDIILTWFEHVGVYVATWTGQAAVVVVLAWVVVRMDRRNRVTLQYRLWSIALLSVFLLPWAPSLLASVSWTQNLKQSLVPPAAQLSFSSGSTTVALESATDSHPLASRVAVSTRLLQLAGSFWVVGVTFTLFRRVRTHRKMRGIIRRALCETPSVLLAPEIPGPMLYGLLKPVILLPADINEWSTSEERTLMLDHERMHYRRRDHWMSAVAAFASMLLFFHPLVHIACRQLAVTRELACDEGVLAQGVEPQSYAETLIKVAEHAVAAPQCGSIAFAASVVALDARIERLFQPPSRVSLAALILFPALLLLMPVAALGFWQSVTPVPIVLPLPPVPSAPQIVDAPPLSIAAAARPGRTVPVREQPTTASFQTEQTTPALEVRVDQLKGSDPRTVVLVTVYVSNTVLNFVEDAGLMRASGRILTDVTGVDGARMRIVSNSFLVERPSQLLKPESYTVFQVRFDLPPGLYKLDVAYEDDKTGKTLVTSNRLAVVRFPTGLATSSLILAANIEVLPSTTPSQPFHVGNFKIRPSVNGEFRRDEALNFALQIYGLSSDVATIETSIVRYGTVVRSLLENVQAASDMTITKTLSLSDFEPGNYSINVTITDARTGEVTRARADFRVR